MAISTKARSRNCVIPSGYPSGIIAILMIAAIGCSTISRLPGLNNFSADAHRGEVPVPWENSHRDAMSKAETTDKVMMLWFTGSDWCKYCTMLEQEVLHTATFNDWYGDKIVPVLLDYPRRTALTPEMEKQNADLMDQYAEQVTSFPTALFVDANGRVLGKLGYTKGGPEQWIEKADAILSNSGRVANSGRAEVY